MNPGSSFCLTFRKLFLWVMLAIGLAEGMKAQNITTTVLPGGSVDLQNLTGNRWYITGSATPAGASMARVSSNLVAVYVWPSAGSFAPDPTSHVQNRIFQNEYLRVYANALPVGTVITIPYNTPNPLSVSYTFKVTVQNAPAVTAITLLDPSPTSAASVRWAVTFSEAISGVTAANFALTNPNGLSGAAITGVSGSGTSWTVTASTGTGTGLLGCNWVGHATEIPTVPNTFTGFQYTFSEYPLITSDPVGATIATGLTHGMSVTALIRGGTAMTYQWYAGSSVTPASATLIGGATGTSYTTPVLGTAGVRQYFCRVTSVANPAFKTDSTTATVNVLAPVAITTPPASTAIASGQTATLTVAATGTAPLAYQWYRGAAGVTTNPVGTNSNSFTTPALTANTGYWVRISNGLPASYNQDSAVATVRVVTTLTGNGPLSATVNTPFATQPTILARDSANAPVAGIVVTLTAPGSGATGSFNSFAFTTAATDAAGVAAPSTFTAGQTTGNFNLTGTYGGLSTTIAMTNVPGPLASIAIVTQPSATATAGSALATQPVLQLRDAFSNLRTQDSATVITASRLGGSGTLQGTTARTAAAGVVTFTDLFHTVAGTITLQFTSGGITATSNDIVVSPSAASTITAAGGSGQTTLPGTAFASALLVTLTDAFANPVSGRLVTFVPPASGASATFPSGATGTTNASGQVSLPVSANGTSGSYQVTANISGPALGTAANFALSQWTNLELWRNTNFGSHADSGTGANSATPRHDGIANLLKYALNLNAAIPDHQTMTALGDRGLPLIGYDASGRLQLTFVRRKAATLPGISYAVMFSSDLAPGWAVNPAATTTATSLNATWERVTVTDSLTVPRRFGRLAVTAP